MEMAENIKKMVDRYGLFVAKVLIFIVFPIAVWMLVLYAVCRLWECF
jgi:hypothetical protein